MTIGSWLLFAIILWFSGFIELKVLDPTPKTVLAYLPKWMFLLFGSPKHPSIPNLVVPARSIFVQVFGITTGIYGLIFDRFISIPYGQLLFGFGFPFLLGLLVSGWLSRIKPYHLNNN